MSLTIPFTEKQKATIQQAQAEVKAIQDRIAVFCSAILQGHDTAVSEQAKVEITPEGIQVTEPEPDTKE